MRKLDRGVAPSPPCLASYTVGIHNWSHVTPAHREETRNHLTTMQGRFCAYCEGPLDTLGEHIEHFRRKHSRPDLTFAWSNLFGSCDRTDSCGHFKDNGAGPYSVDDLLDPTVDEPDLYLRFYSDDGRVEARVSAPSIHRASETIRVFNLDIVRLRTMRKQAFSTFEALEPNVLDALVDFEPETRQEFVAEMRERARQEPFSAIICHFFEGIA